MLKYGISIGRDNVSPLLKIIDPEGVQLRRSNCLTRRTYWNCGPNYLIHRDGYDKIKQFGFAIHGAICGFSRRILWLRVGRTNNNPIVVASYFLDYIKEINGAPRRIRIDAGTENTVIEDIQKAFRWYEWREKRHHLEVTIKSENRTLMAVNEADGHVLLDRLLQRFRAQGHYVYSKPFAYEWNHHTIRLQRKSNGCGCPSGKPDIIFSHPELFGTSDFKCPFSNDDIRHFQAFCNIPRPSGCMQEIEEHCIMLLQSPGRTEPNIIPVALDCFEWLVHRL